MGDVERGIRALTAERDTTRSELRNLKAALTDASEWREHHQVWHHHYRELAQVYKNQRDALAESLTQARREAETTSRLNGEVTMLRAQVNELRIVRDERDALVDEKRRQL